MGIEIERKGAVAVVRVKGGRANAMSHALLAELERVFGSLEADAVVLTGDGSAFSAGLALPDLIGLERDAMRVFMTQFERAMLAVLKWPRATVAAINGHAIAGGCVLALMCDVRVAAAGDAKLGLNEIQLGIGLPSLVIEPLRARVPAASIASIAYEGRLLAVGEAIGRGLIDAVAPEAELIDTCVTRAAGFARSPVAYAQIKKALLRPTLEAISANAEAEREVWLDSWFSEPARSTLKATVEKLQHK